MSTGTFGASPHLHEGPARTTHRCGRALAVRYERPAEQDRGWARGEHMYMSVDGPLEYRQIGRSKTDAAGATFGDN